jgi:hypothetical protein
MAAGMGAQGRRSIQIKKRFVVLVCRVGLNYDSNSLGCLKNKNRNILTLTILTVFNKSSPTTDKRRIKIVVNIKCVKIGKSV